MYSAQTSELTVSSLPILRYIPLVIQLQPQNNEKEDGKVKDADETKCRKRERIVTDTFIIIST